MDLIPDLKARLEAARDAGSPLLEEEVERALALAGQSQPATAEAIDRVILETLDARFLHHRRSLAELAGQALRNLVAHIKRHSQEDPRRRGLVHFVVCLFADNVKAGGTSHHDQPLWPRLPSSWARRSTDQGSRAR